MMIDQASCGPLAGPAVLSATEKLTPPLFVRFAPEAQKNSFIAPGTFDFRRIHP
jgi:hypothetical protein